MQEESVVAAVRQLRAAGQRVTLRAVHAITGGSHRDLTRLLRELLADDEVSELEVDTIEPVPPLPGQLAIAHEAVQAAEVAVGEVQNLLDAAQDRLRILQRQRPESTTDPHQVADIVSAQLQHEFDTLSAQREVEALQRILDGRRAEQSALKADLERLRERAHHLKTITVPSLQRELVEARRYHEQREREVVNAAAIARRQVEQLEHAIEATESELQQLTGEQAR
jgi:hypothetical protein